MRIFQKKISRSEFSKTVRYQFLGLTIIKKHRSPAKRYIKIFNIPVYKRMRHNTNRVDVVQKFFGLPIIRKSISNNKKKTYLFGIRLKSRAVDLEKNVKTSQEAGLIFPPASVLPNKKVLIIAELSIPQCTKYRVEAKKDALELYGYTVDICPWHDVNSCMDKLQTASFVIFYRVPFFEGVQEYYKEASRLGIHKVFDIDDLIFDYDLYAKEIRENHNFDKKMIDSLLNGVALFRSALTKADSVWVSTQKLYDIVKTKGQDVHIIENSIIKGTIQKDISCRFVNSNIKIFYGVGSPHDSDFKLVYPALEKILLEFENVDVYIHGELNITYIDKKIRGRFFDIDRVKAEEYYFAISQYDIAIMPLVKSTFNEAKSNIKYIEASCLKIPSIASGLQEFSNVITQGVDGFIASSPEEWYTHLKTLICDESLRREMGKKAYDNVMSRYSLELSGKKMAKLIEKTLPSRKTRILIVNILYGVSSFGGATVVAEALAEKIQYNSEYEVIVFSAHFDSTQPLGALRRYTWNSVQVISVNLSHISQTYWDNNLGIIFSEIINDVKPSLVHFHCIQTLGMKLLQACIDINIPYVITIHDGWWRCARQFLVDTEKKFCGNETMSAFMCKKRCQIQASTFFDRLRKSDLYLSEAKIVYTPTQYFTEFVRRDFPKINLKTNKNGILDSFFVKRHSKDRKKVTFGFFGGRDDVKGYFVMKETLTSYDSHKYDLVLIDTVRRDGFPGLICTDDWGDNVTILGYTPHDEMVKVYKKIDVLLFPSSCKESFGLVVREAIANNVFVICSECGGPMEAIVHGKNGLVFPMDDIEKFKECIDYVFEHEEEILNYKTTEFGDVRTFDVQAKELIEDYKAILSEK